MLVSEASLVYVVEILFQKKKDNLKFNVILIELRPK